MTSTLVKSPDSPTAVWTRETVAALYHQPLMALVAQAMNVHQAHHDPLEMQMCTLSNIKSGNCSEDCAYCPQSARYNTGIDTWQLPSTDEIRVQAQAARANGSTRFCMGAAWRELRDNAEFDQVCDLVKTVKNEGLEVCVTLGMLNAEQAIRLKEAGVYAYNHNIDTSREFYPSIITTRTFDDRLQTIQNVQAAGMEVCCGGIMGLGESDDDRISFITTLAEMNPAPQSVPINALVPVEGTPLAGNPVVSPFELVRTIATVRCCIPTAVIRLSAGRTQMTDEAQALCFLAGANSIFTGEVLLTTPNPGSNRDQQLMNTLGLTPRVTAAQY